ncbi:MAG: ABC-ATPase domain-containing protein [Ardenticatenaceae bacterium]|nr:ABC-ATPase domain-containing protein [Anaerolineales bacterium]MCB8923499.1 ABC-ATPase domain-containing protein [Ardenticatenaceae bacterium]MCB9003776.1 ABC-ATPase domain-containing protein [Ardenticatenaceae bacterium]
MATQDDLKRILQRIDGRGYKAYKEIVGRPSDSRYTFPTFTLYIDYVQGDPFAAPSRLRVRVPQTQAQYPAVLFSNDSRRIGLESYLAAAFGQACHAAAGRSGSGKSGLIEIDAPGQEMMERTAVTITPEFVEARFVVGLPAQGRRVLGRQAAIMLTETVPQLVEAALFYRNGRADLMQRYAHTNEDADALRQQLTARGLVAFVADGSMLPRRSGVDNRPLDRATAVPFQSPPSLRVTLQTPNGGAVSGMGIPLGVTLIVGGGFHGKSTLLNALEQGIYNHRPGDGREQVVSDPSAVKIRAEDGRRVAGVNISPFINQLPFGQDTAVFSSDNASGSTSQAANIIEALELGASALLIDEDTAATNFMIRDQRMQALIAKDKEPITPFIDKVRQLYDEKGVSSILVIGGSGDYFDVADRVIALDSYVPQDVTAAAQAIAAQHKQERQREGGAHFGEITPRIPLPRSIDPSKGRRDVSVKTRGLRTVQFGTETIDLSAVAQLVDDSQTRALAAALVYAWERYMDGERPLAAITQLVMQDISQRGLDVLSRYPVGDFAAIRPFEFAAALNRLRTLQIR